MAEITEAIKSGHEDPPVLDWERVKGEFGDQIKELVNTQVEEKLAAQPIFKGAPISAYEKAVIDGSLKNNRYSGMLKSFTQDGKYKDFAGSDYRPLDLWLADYYLTKGALEFPDRYQPPSNDLKMALKALDSTTAGTGDELVPTDMAAALWEDVHLDNVLVSNLQPVTMTTNPLDLPNALGDVTFRKGSENTAYTASDPATAKNTLTVTELGAEVDWSYTLDEDAVVAMMPAVRRTIARNAAEYADGFCLNADGTTAATGNINSDDAAPAADNYYMSAGQDGIRHLFIVDNTSQHYNMNANLTDAGINLALRSMGKYAANPRDLLMIMDVETYIRGMLNATTTNAPGSFLRSEADTGYSIIVQGQISSYRGIPIVIPTLAGKAEADGKQSATAASNTLGALSIINRSQWRVGFRRQMLIEVDRDIQKRQIIMVVSFRIAVGCRGTRSSATHTAGIRNITVAT
jgi:hypothetical protein